MAKVADRVREFLHSQKGRRMARQAGEQAKKPENQGKLRQFIQQRRHK
jgi:hypothetical protein